MPLFKTAGTLRLIALLLVLALLGACSSTRLAYRFADQGIIWWVEDYVSLTREQKSTLRRELDVLLDWHCEQELPRYSDWLGELRREMADGALPPDRIEHHRQQVTAFAEPLAARIVPMATRLLASLSDKQTRELVRNMAQSQAERREEYLGDDSRARAAERVRERAERWLGTLNDRQQAIVAEWSRDREQQTRIWLDGRGRWQQALAERLGQRDAPDFRAHLRDLILNAPDYQGETYRNMMATNTRDLTRLTHDLLMAADERHWQHLQGETTDLKKDVTALACTIPQ